MAALLKAATLYSLVATKCMQHHSQTIPLVHRTAVCVYVIPPIAAVLYEQSSIGVTANLSMQHGWTGMVSYSFATCNVCI